MCETHTLIIRDCILFPRLRNAPSRRRDPRRFVYIDNEIRVKKNRRLESLRSREEARRDDSSLRARSSRGQICNAICARVYVNHATPRGVERSECVPGSTKGARQYSFKTESSESASRETGRAGRPEEASKSKSERVTVGDPAAGCRQHSYNTVRPTHRAQYTLLTPTTSTTRAHANAPHVQYRTAWHRRPWEPR